MPRVKKTQPRSSRRAAIAPCRKRRVKILIAPVETRVCWMAWIADPAGNRICLHSRKDGTAG
jgi:predicted enzyme related to lactoylglutathione lyase